MNGEVALIVAFVLALGLIAMGYGVNNTGVDLFESGILGDNGLLDSVNNSGNDEDNLIEEPSISESGNSGG